MLVGCENPSSTTEDDKKTDPPAGDTSVTVTVLAVPGVIAPVRDAVPSTAAIDTAQYTGAVSWSPADNPFAASTVYTATITLTAKTGFKFAGVAANSFTVTGATATNASDSGVVTAVFPATAAAAVPVQKLVPSSWNGNWEKSGTLKIVVKDGAIYAADGTTELFPGNLGATCNITYPAWNICKATLKTNTSKYIQYTMNANSNGISFTDLINGATTGIYMEQYGPMP